VQTRTIVLRVVFVTKVFSHLVIGMVFVVVVCSDANDSLFVKDESCMKTAAILFLRS
jgi:hypothetical protein